MPSFFDIVRELEIMLVSIVYIIYILLIRFTSLCCFFQGKRGIEKQPFQLPDFIAATGIEKIRQVT
jgi:hypothetical protein